VIVDLSFTIDWNIEEEHWERTRAYVTIYLPGGQSGQIGQTFFWMLGGHLHLCDQNARLFPQDRLHAIAKLGRISWRWETGTHAPRMVFGIAVPILFWNEFGWF